MSVFSRKRKCYTMNVVARLSFLARGVVVEAEVYGTQHLIMVLETTDNPDLGIFQSREIR